jgi:tripartite ATP-independent transporter DctP family solute receptor
MNERSGFLSIFAATLATAFIAMSLASLVQAREVKLAHLAPANDPRHESMEQFAKMIEERTNGEITVKIFPKSQLGKDREIFEQLQGGLTEFALNGEIISNFYVKWSIINMPYLWRDQDHLRKFVRSDIVANWVDETREATGVQILGFFERNPRILTTKKAPVNSIDDIQGLKISVPRIDVYMDTWRAFGVQPTPMSAAEFFMGLKLGTVDGMENPIEVMYHWKIYEVSKYISFTNHMQTRLFLTASGKFLDSLTPEQRKIVMETGKDAEKLHAAKMEKMIEDLSVKLEEKGMVLVKNPDISGFKEKAKQVHEKYKPIIGADAFEAAVNM